MILVTGATGFVGRHLIKRLLKENYEIRCLVRNEEKAKILGDKLNVWFGDITNKNSLKGICKDVDIVFHLASLTPGNILGCKKERFRDVNFSGTKNLLEECIHEKIKKFIYFSSIAAIGQIKKRLPVDEHDKCIPNSLYGISEYQTEKLLLKYQKKFGIRVIILRPTWIYSDLDKKEPWRLKKSIKTRIVPIIGNGRYIVDLIHIDDVIEASMLTLRKKIRGGIYIIHGKNYLWFDIVNYAIKKYDKKVLKIYVPENFYKFFSSILEGFFSIFGRTSYFTSERLKFMKAEMKYSGKKAYKKLGFKAKEDFFFSKT